MQDPKLPNHQLPPSNPHMHVRRMSFEESWAIRLLDPVRALTCPLPFPAFTLQPLL